MAPSPPPGLATVLLTLLVASPGLAGCLADDPGSRTSPSAGEEAADRTAGPGEADGRNRTSGADDPNGTDAEGETGADATAPNGSSEAEAEAPSYPTSFTTWGCETTFTMFEVPKRWAADRTPDGFEPITFFPASAFVPAAPDRTVRASFLVASNHCDRITYDGPGVEESHRTGVSKLYYGVFVDAPEAYEAEEKTSVYPLRFVSSTEGEAGLLSSWGLPAETGDVALSAKADQGNARSWTLTAEAGNASARVDLQTSGTASAGDEPATFRFFGSAGDGPVDRAMDYQVQAPNSTQNLLVPGAMNAVVDLDAPDAPYPAPTSSPIAVTRWTPSDKAAQHASLVTFGD